MEIGTAEMDPVDLYDGSNVGAFETGEDDGEVVFLADGSVDGLVVRVNDGEVVFLADGSADGEEVFLNGAYKITHLNS